MEEDGSNSRKQQQKLIEMEENERLMGQIDELKEDEDLLQGLDQLDKVERDQIKKMSSTSLLDNKDLQELRKLETEAEQLKERIVENIENIAKPISAPVVDEPVDEEPEDEIIKNGEPVVILQGGTGQQDPTPVPEQKPDPEDQSWKMGLLVVGAALVVAGISYMLKPKRRI